MAKGIGQGSSITVASVAYPFTTSALKIDNDVQDVTDTGSGGWVARIAGCSSAEVTGEMFWGGTASVLSSVFTPGADATLTYLIGDGGEVATVPVIISTCSVNVDAKTPIKFSFTALSNGEVTLPA